MKSKNELKEIALQTLEIEAQSISGLGALLGDGFFETVQIIFSGKGRVVVTGIGKSALVAGKIVATLNSTGTPAIFMHAADAIHGDLGIIQQNDIVICISKSGNTPEIKVLVPLLKQAGNKLVAMVGNLDSYLARECDLVLNTTVQKEACPNNLAPTSSSIAQMALGDALAVCLLECRGFTSEDFARFHPGGALGKRLYLRVDDVYKQNEAPVVSPADSISTVILEISSKRLGATAVVEENQLRGIITDGDLRRMLQQRTDLTGLTAADIMTRSPKYIGADELAVNALELMKANNITQLVVTNGARYLGFIHLHDLIREGVI